MIFAFFQFPRVECNALLILLVWFYDMKLDLWNSSTTHRFKQRRRLQHMQTIWVLGSCPLRNIINKYIYINIMPTKTTSKPHHFCWYFQQAHFDSPDCWSPTKPFTMPSQPFDQEWIGPMEQLFLNISVLRNWSEWMNRQSLLLDSHGFFSGWWRVRSYEITKTMHGTEGQNERTSYFVLLDCFDPRWWQRFAQE